MDFSPTDIPDVIKITPRVFQDHRGEFFETFRAQEYAAAGIPGPFVQDNHSRSRQGVLRGLHYQIRQAQGKLIHVVLGEVYDVAVDLRQSSPHFGKSIGIRLDDQQKQQLWIPPGFAHGFYVLSDWAEVSYKVTDYYAPEWERTLHWNDPDLEIDWPIKNTDHPILSAGDAAGTSFQEAEIYG